MKRKKDWACHDVMWFSDKFKNPIAYSSKADSDFIALINIPHKTAYDLMEILTSGEYLYAPDAIEVIQAFIDRGCGDEIIRTREM